MQHRDWSLLLLHHRHSRGQRPWRKTCTGVGTNASHTRMQHVVCARHGALQPPGLWSLLLLLHHRHRLSQHLYCTPCTADGAETNASARMQSQQACRPFGTSTQQAAQSRWRGWHLGMHAWQTQKQVLSKSRPGTGDLKRMQRNPACSPDSPPCLGSSCISSDPITSCNQGPLSGLRIPYMPRWHTQLLTGTRAHEPQSAAHPTPSPAPAQP